MCTRWQPPRAATAVQQTPGGDEIVPGELRFRQAADLGVADDDRVGTVQSLLPGAWFRHVGLDHLDVRMQLAQDAGVGFVLVDRRRLYGCRAVSVGRSGFARSGRPPR